jgi:hypothetical protein
MKNTYALVGGIDAWSQQVDRSISRYKLEMWAVFLAEFDEN